MPERSTIPDPAETSPADHPERPRSIILAALTAAALSILIAEFVAHRYDLGPIDDAYISFRYAKNWATGRGLCYNPGERVEGYTNFLWVALNAALIRAGVEPLTAQALLGRAAHAALAATLTIFLARRAYPGRTAFAGAGAIAITSHVALIAWAVSGMETILLALLVTTGILLAATTASPRHAAIAAALLVLAALTRPDAVVFFPVGCLAVLLAARAWRPLAVHAGVLAVAFGAYFALRAAWFGHLFPNTFYAKLDYGNTLLAQRGLRYVADFLLASAPLVILAAIALFRLRRAPAWVPAALAGVVVQLLAVIYMGGDHFPLFRFAAPILPLLALLALYPAAELLRVRPTHKLTAPASWCTLTILIGSSLLMDRSTHQKLTEGMSQLAFHQFTCRNAREWEHVGRWLHSVAPDDDASVATVAIGAVGYFSGLRVIDPHGLVNPAIAHRDQPLGRGYSGHEKFDVDQVLAQRPTFILLIHYLTPQPLPRHVVPAAAWERFNRELARRPELDRDYEYAHAPISGRYLNYFVRRDAAAKMGMARDGE